MSKIIRLVDRSRTTTDWKCPRARFWNYEYAGRGIVSNSIPLELWMGDAIHNGLAGIAKGYPIDQVAEAAFRQMHLALSDHLEGEVSNGERDFPAEQATLVEGLVRGYHKFIWPKLQAQFPKVLYVEEEMEYPLGDMIFMSKPDLVLANDDTTCYVEYKSTSSKTDQWINSWDTAVQLHSTVKAIEHTKGIKVDQVQVIGLYKGYESYHKQNSTFCYCYRRAGSPPFSQDQIRYDYTAGFKRHPVWQLPGGIKKWVQDMPEEVLVNNFPCSPPIFVNDDLVAAFYKQREWREKEIELAMQMMDMSTPEAKAGIMDVAFPQKFDQCAPGWGSKCLYRPLCFSNMGDDPLQHGFTFREAHHAREAQQFEKEDQDAKP